MNKRILIISNPRSGKNKKRIKAQSLATQISVFGFDVDVMETGGKGDAISIAKNHHKEYDYILSCGGDGTLNEVINGVMPEPDVSLIYFPNGTTNDSAKTLGIDGSISQIIALIKRESFHPVDVGVINGRSFFCAASFGFGAKASYSTKQSIKNEIGHLAYILSGIKNVSDIKPVHMKIECNDGIIEGDYIFGAVVNTISVGGIFRLDENDFWLDDGLFEIVLVSSIDRVTQIPIMIRKLQKREYDGKRVILIKTDKVKFTSDRPVGWLVDGEYGGDFTTASVENLHRAISICSPAHSLFGSI